jgi:hypothetical protein
MTGKTLAKFAQTGVDVLDGVMDSYGGSRIAQEVTFVGDSGVKIRIDGVYQMPDGRVVFGEAKIGDHADLSRNQKIGIPELNDGKGYFTGANAAEVAKALDVKPDANGHFRLPPDKIGGAMVHTHDRSTPQTQRMKAVSEAYGKRFSGGQE